MSKTPYPPDRRRLLVNEQFQLGFSVTLTLIGVLLVNVVVIGAVILHPPLRIVALNPLYVGVIALVEVALILAMLMMSLLQGKRIIGPVLGMRRIVHALERGDLSQRLAVRKGEHFRELLEETNRSLDAMEQHIVALRGLCHDAHLSRGDEEALTESLAALSKRLCEMTLNCDAQQDKDADSGLR